MSSVNGDTLLRGAKARNSHRVICPECKGKGWVEYTKELNCRLCGGEGILWLPEPTVRQMVADRWEAVHPLVRLVLASCFAAVALAALVGLCFWIGGLHL